MDEQSIAVGRVADNIYRQLTLTHQCYINQERANLGDTPAPYKIPSSTPMTQPEGPEAAGDRHLEKGCFGWEAHARYEMPS